MSNARRVVPFTVERLLPGKTTRELLDILGHSGQVQIMELENERQGVAVLGALLEKGIAKFTVKGTTDYRLLAAFIIRAIRTGET